MADMRDSRKPQPPPRKPQPHSPEAPGGRAQPAQELPAVVRQSKSRSKKGHWFKENRAIVIGGAVAGFALVVVLGLLFGWFTGGTDKPAARQVAQNQQPAPQTQAAPAAPAPAQPETPKTTEPKKEEPKKEEPKKEAPPLSDDPATWKKADFLRARHENHPKLLEAITLLAEKHRDSEPVARDLIDLLKPLPTATPPDKPADKPADKPKDTPAPNQIRIGEPTPPLGPSPQNPGDPASLVETIVKALGCNTTKLARGAIEQILAGTLVTDADKVAVETALRALVEHPGDSSDALLLRVLTATEELRPDSRMGPWPAKDMRARALELVKPAASVGLRTKLAEGLIAHHVAVDPKDPTYEFLFVSNPANCGAQLAFYLQPDAKKDLKATLEPLFLSYSSAALARHLGVATDIQGSPGSPSSPGGSPNVAIGVAGPGASAAPRVPSPPVAPSVPAGEAPKMTDADLAARVANCLWAGEFCNRLESELGDLRSWEKQPQLMLMAATVPTDSTRAALAKLLRKRWKNDSPKTLETAGLNDQLVTDPGLLAIIKTFPRQPTEANRAENPMLKSKRPTRSNRPFGGPRPGGAGQAKQPTEQEWMEVSSKLVTAWCKRLSAAAEAKKDDAGTSPLPGDFRLAPDAKIVASHRVIFPGGAGIDASQVQSDPLEVYYVRAEETTKPKKAITFYTGQAKARPADIKTLDKAVWIDGVRLGAQKDRRRSTDVLITATREVANGEEETDLVIEVLIIELKDPTVDHSVAKPKEAAK
jgi:hypothetical protein